MKTYYSQIKEIQQLVFSGDDRIDQEKLFDLQNKISLLALDIAQEEHKTTDLVQSFSFLYKPAR